MILTNFSQTEIIISIIGVIGTLIGVFLGWGLSILSNAGKLYFTRKGVDISDYQIDTKSIPGKVKVLSGGTLKFYFDVFNSSGRNKYIQNIELVFKKNNKITFKKETTIILGKHIISKTTDNDSENRKIETENSIPLVSVNGGSSVIESENIKSIVGEARLYEKNEIFNFDSIYLRYTTQKENVKTVFLCHRVDIKGQQHWVE